METTFGAAAITTNFFLVFVVAARVLLWDWVGELNFGDLEVVGVVTGSMSADEEAMGGVVLTRVTGGRTVSGVRGGEG